MANPQTVEHPTVQIDGFTYSLKFGTGAQLRLERFGLPPDKMREAFVYEEKDGKETVVSTRLPLTVLFATLAACAGTPQAGGRWKPIGKTPEELADSIPSEEIRAIADAIGEMWSKVQPDGKKPATDPASQPDPKLN